MTPTEDWSPEQLVITSGSYWHALTVHTGVKLDIFTLIGDEQMHVEDVAGRLNADSRGVGMLLNALVALGLLARKNKAYINTPFGRSFLVKTSPRYMGHMIMHHHHLVETWARLDQAVQSGKPVRKSSGPSESERKSFLMGMFNMAMSIAPHLVKEVDLSGRERLLDLGGGPGTYAIHFCVENPELRATVYDLPTTAPYAKETIERFGVSDRVDFVAGDIVTQDIPGTYDVVWLSHLLHAMGPGTCRHIIDKTVSVLRPGGIILIHDFILNNTLDGPVFPAVFSLNMLVNTEEGQSYSESQIADMMAKAGLKDIRRLPFVGPTESGIMQASRP